MKWQLGDQVVTSRAIGDGWMDRSTDRQTERHIDRQKLGFKVPPVGSGLWIIEWSRDR